MRRRRCDADISISVIAVRLATAFQTVQQGTPYPSGIISVAFREGRPKYYRAIQPARSLWPNGATTRILQPNVFALLAIGRRRSFTPPVGQWIAFEERRMGKDFGAFRKESPSRKRGYGERPRHQRSEALKFSCGHKNQLRFRRQLSDQSLDHDAAVERRRK